MQVHSGLSQSPEHRECPRRFYLQANDFLCKPEHSLPFREDSFGQHDQRCYRTFFLPDLAIELLSLKQVQADKQNFYSNYGLVLWDLRFWCTGAMASSFKELCYTTNISLVPGRSSLKQVFV